MPPIEPHIPTTPFEAIVADYFHLEGNYFLVIGDRLSGWTEVKGVRKNSFTSGAAGLCAALRSMFVTFGVPVEISSDGGPEFKAHETESFLKRWGVKHMAVLGLPAAQQWARGTCGEVDQAPPC